MNYKNIILKENFIYFLSDFIFWMLKFYHYLSL